MKRTITTLLILAIAFTCMAVTIAETDDAWAPYEETVTLKIPYYQNTSYQMFDGDDEYNNVWTRYLKDTFNIQWNVTMESGDVTIRIKMLPSALKCIPCQ